MTADWPAGRQQLGILLLEAVVWQAWRLSASAWVVKLQLLLQLEMARPERALGDVPACQKTVSAATKAGAAMEKLPPENVQLASVSPES